MKTYQSPELTLWQLKELSIFTASGDKDEWESEIIPDDEDPEDQ